MKNFSTKFFMGLLIGVFTLTTISAQGLYRSSDPAANKKMETINANNPGNPLMSTPRNTFFQETWETNSFATNGWVLTDADGDGFNWVLSSTLTSHTGTYCAGSNSWVSTAGPLTPDNWMGSKAIDLTAATGTIILEYWVRAQDQTWPSEHYGVYASTSGNKPADFLGANGTKLFEETIVKGTDNANKLYVKRSLDLSSYAGKTAYIAFRHFDCTDMFILDIDDIIVFQSTITDVGITGVASPVNATGCTKTAEEDVTVTLFNYGGTPQTNFTVSYTFNGNTVTETYPDTLQPATSANFTFAQKLDLSTLGYFTMTFNVVVDGDSDASNNNFTHEIRSTDGMFTIVASTDGSGSQAWELINTAGDIVGSHEAYQWFVTETTNVCILADDCYIFNWLAGSSSENTVTLSYNETQLFTELVTGSFDFYSIGDACEPVNALLISHLIPDYEVLGNVGLAGAMRNIGKENINSYDVQYSINGVAADKVTVSNLDIAPGTVFVAGYPTAHNFDALGSYDIVITYSNFNGTYTPEENEFAQTINILSYKPTTRIFGEEGTGTWCGWCPRGAVYMEYMENAYPDTWVGVAVHNGDPMTVSAYDTGVGSMISGYPSGLVNRHNFGAGFDVDPSLFEEAYNILIDRVVPVDLTITGGSFEASNRKLQFTMEAKFAGNLAKDFTVFGVVVEHGVRGSAAGYNQTNYYAGGANGPMGGFESLPDPVPAASMVYENVGRALLGGFAGLANVIPNPTTDGGLYNYNFSYTVPATENVDHMVLIVAVLDKATGEIVNVVKKTYEKTVGTQDVMAELVDFEVAPNPSAGQFRIKFNLENAEEISVFVTDMVGRRVATISDNEKISHLDYTLDLSAQNNGVYLINVQSANGVSVQKIVKQ